MIFSFTLIIYAKPIRYQSRSLQTLSSTVHRLHRLLINELPVIVDGEKTTVSKALSYTCRCNGITELANRLKGLHIDADDCRAELKTAFCSRILGAAAVKRETTPVECATIITFVSHLAYSQEERDQ